MPGDRRDLICRAVRVEGLVQGVGFRPHVHRLARALGLVGTVRNGPAGVEIVAAGPAEAIDGFLEQLERQPPSLARVDRVTSRAAAAPAATEFTIVTSGAAGPAITSVPLDAATCADCRRELIDPADRRHRYPFINCTACGPRFTILSGLPYDRPLTTMERFTMCDDCRAEYEDPNSRRFHAQPNACPACGPRARLVDGEGRETDGDDPLVAAAAALAAGRIVAIKGLGGFHLACAAKDQQAVLELRRRKGRETRPLAVMVPDLEAARRVAVVDEAAAGLLAAPAAPIVLLPKRADDPLAAAVAPGCAEHGLMLAYTPLHALVFDELGLPPGAPAALVMTSANPSGEPMVRDNDAALEQLGGVADLFLWHDRDIAHRADDSVIRPTPAGPVFLRRSRGHAPAELELPVACDEPLLAVGALLKCAITLARGRRAVLGPHVGGSGTVAAVEALGESAAGLGKILGVEPAAVACDMHPDLPSTRWARERGLPVIPVQHHRAHVAACLVDAGRWEPVIGVALDGFGHGDDGQVWGGEIFAGEPHRLERRAHLRSVPQPGGDLGARFPWRMALAHLEDALGGGAVASSSDLFAGVDPLAVEVAARQIHGGPATPLTSSAGRLFDAVAALCLGCLENRHEAQSAARLEAAVDPGEVGVYPLELRRREGAPFELDTRPLVRSVVEDLERGEGPGRVAARFHNGLARALVAICERLCDETGIGLVALGGGVFANAALLGRLVPALVDAGLEVCAPRRVPPGDGGLSLGQAAIAAATLAAKGEISCA